MLNKEHQILIIAKNTNGIVARIMSLFNRRGYFVKKMSAGVTNKEGHARLTLTVDGDKESLDQIQKQVYKIIDVVKVKIFPEKDVIRRELMLLKVKADEETRSQIVQIANIYRGNILDVSPKSLVIELTGDIEKLRGFIGMMSNYGILEIAKTGIVAMSRGEKM
ncbi:acetolactate synthase small subunit [Fusobacterium pseudoperiodonticum]|uniref:Acetolactate synthase small subunit n=1 Tax=Fusobacterium pseudoperiodonticum TaxID=2663009 RepID=A0A2D3PNP7_9FUSO|nr:acetolactate synthase small subunit [Fusobacterium pseudoperiodonticum]ATV69313.1 acetolactate synthase small subunit [Fusobacterium pseudoperiodonticum]